MTPILAIMLLMGTAFALSTGSSTEEAENDDEALSESDDTTQEPVTFDEEFYASDFTEDELINDDFTISGTDGNTLVSLLVAEDGSDTSDTFLTMPTIITAGGDDTVEAYSMDGFISTGDGNDTVNLISSDIGGNTIDTGNGNDVVHVTSLTDERMDFEEYLNIKTGEGDDTINISGYIEGGHVNIEAGDGDDVAKIQTIPTLSVVDMGDGDDSIEITDASVAGATLLGGSGNDTFLLKVSEVSALTAYGTSGTAAFTLSDFDPDKDSLTIDVTPTNDGVLFEGIQIEQTTVNGSTSNTLVFFYQNSTGEDIDVVIELGNNDVQLDDINIILNGSQFS